MALTSSFCQVHKLLRVITLKMHPFPGATMGSMRELGMIKGYLKGISWELATLNPILFLEKFGGIHDSD